MRKTVFEVDRWLAVHLLRLLGTLWPMCYICRKPRKVVDVDVVVVVVVVVVVIVVDVVVVVVFWTMCNVLYLLQARESCGCGCCCCCPLANVLYLPRRDLSHSCNGFDLPEGRDHQSSDERK